LIRLSLAPALLALGVPMAASGCGGVDPAPTDDDPVEAGVTYRKDVKPIVEARCVPCHREGGAAPFSLEHYTQVRSTRSTIAAVTADGTMPPWHAAGDCAEYVADRSLTDAEIATFAAFAAGDGPEGTEDGAPVDVGPTFALSRVDRSLTMTEPYLPAIERGDDYRCFVLDWPENSTTHVTGLRVTPGATGNVHHAIAFVASPGEVAAIDELDASEAGPGYTCYGGPQAPASWLGVWVPGTGGADYPPGTGIEVVPGSKVILQVHYSAHGHDAEPDVTSLDLKLDADVAKKAWIQPWTDPTWQGEGGMKIPAGEADVVHSASFDPGLFLTNGQPLTIYSLGLHMHELGRSGRVWVDRAGGGAHPPGEECLLEIPAWDFHWQGAYGFVEPRTIYPGDRLGIECRWDNSLENQPSIDGQRQVPRDVEWGEGTTDEMCLAALYVTL
jgi:hypothetical protein